MLVVVIVSGGDAEGGCEVPQPMMNHAETVFTRQRGLEARFGSFVDGRLVGCQNRDLRIIVS